MVIGSSSAINAAACSGVISKMTRCSSSRNAASSCCAVVGSWVIARNHLAADRSRIDSTSAEAAKVHGDDMRDMDLGNKHFL